MQFIQGGPDIPDHLLHAHEDGRVVFFCGAGISYPAKLPGFGGLVDKLYEFIGEGPDAIELEFQEKKQFDHVIGRFEDRVQGGRVAVRRALPRILAPNLEARGALTTHLALLTLGRTRKNQLRLVTTNFDRLFREAADRYRLPPFVEYPDPPARARWEGLVYLHGRISATSGKEELERLVLSDGDFGLAYLTEGWAARFVESLFRRFTVCFVGYSIDDPVLRYMTAAHSLAEVGGEMFAFGSADAGTEHMQERSWRAKNVTPILYSSADGHRKLHQTLQVWASLYRGRVAAKERVVARTARRAPSASTAHDDFIGRLLWAISDSSGLAAKRFADLEPTPSLDWLQIFTERRFGRTDLGRFGLSDEAGCGNTLSFSLLCRPAPHQHSVWSQLASRSQQAPQWDAVMQHLARWLVRYLDDPRLILFVAQSGGSIHPQFAWQIERELEDIARHDAAHASAPRIEGAATARLRLRPQMHMLWRLVLAGRLAGSGAGGGLYAWKPLLDREGLTLGLRTQWRELLAPRLLLRKPVSWTTADLAPEEASSLRRSLSWTVVLATRNVREALSGYEKSAQWRSCLPALLHDTQTLLLDALDMMRELGEAGEDEDPSLWHLPSISPHWQNRGFHDWIALIEVVRDSWLAILAQDPGKAWRIAQDWWSKPYPLFKRLALFAASQTDTDNDAVSADVWVRWLLENDAKWLWSRQTLREVCRLLVLKGAQLAAPLAWALQAMVVNGPPRSYFRQDTSDEDVQAISDHHVWLRLAKLRSSAASLSQVTLEKLASLEATNPSWKKASHERDEFGQWMSGTGDPDTHEWRRFETVPRRRAELVAWLRLPPSDDAFHENDWREVCTAKFATAATALFELAQEGVWPAQRWQEALYAWTNAAYAHRSWHRLASTVQSMPQSEFDSSLDPLAWWLHNISRGRVDDRTLFLRLCRRVLDSGQASAEEDPDAEAMDQPVGRVADGLLRLTLRGGRVGDGIAPDVRDVLTELLDPARQPRAYGRTVISAHAAALFEADQAWTQRHVLPLFDWTASPDAACRSWVAFLLRGRLTPAFLSAVQCEFLDIAERYERLGAQGARYAELLTRVGVERPADLNVDEIRRATRVLPQEGLDSVARTLSQLVSRAREQAPSQWTDHVQRYWQQVWPKSRAFASKEIAEQLYRLCIATGECFPSALETVIDWLQPIEYPHYIVHLLHESGLCARFPGKSLQLLESLIDGQVLQGAELLTCLQEIRANLPMVAGETAFHRLMEHARQSG